MGPEIESIDVYVCDGSEADQTVYSGDDTNDDADGDHAPKPVFHTDDFIHHVHIVERNEGFPAFLSGLFKNAPGGDDEKSVEDDEVN